MSLVPVSLPPGLGLVAEILMSTVRRRLGGNRPILRTPTIVFLDNFNLIVVGAPGCSTVDVSRRTPFIVRW